MPIEYGYFEDENKLGQVKYLRYSVQLTFTLAYRTRTLSKYGGEL